MASGSDLSTDLTLGVLTPAASARAVERHSTQEDTQRKTRRRLRREEGNHDEDDLSSESSENSNHQLDDLA